MIIIAISKYINISQNKKKYCDKLVKYIYIYISMYGYIGAQCGPSANYLLFSNTLIKEKNIMTLIFGVG